MSKYGWGRMLIGFMDMTTVGFLQRFRNCPMHFAGKVAGFLVGLGGSLLVASIVVAIMGGAGVSTLVIIGALSILTGILVCIQGLMLEQQVYKSMDKGRKQLVAETMNSDRELVSYRADKVKYTNRFLGAL